MTVPSGGVGGKRQNLSAINVTVHVPKRYHARGISKSGFAKSACFSLLTFLRRVYAVGCARKTADGVRFKHLRGVVGPFRRWQLCPLVSKCERRGSRKLESDRSLDKREVMRSRWMMHIGNIVDTWSPSRITSSRDCPKDTLAVGRGCTVTSMSSTTFLHRFC